MKVFLAGTYTRERLFREEMPKPLYILESFYYVKEWQMQRMQEWKMFLLDSGAFTFMSNTSSCDFDKYLYNYIQFINKYDIKYFFELDIDNVVGYEKVLQMREILEKETGKKCIPVWHKKRGLQDFEETTKKYNYVAIGGIVTKEIQKKDYDIFSYLLSIAHKNQCRVHGLGFTSTEGMKKYRFDSVDSTKWLSASRYAQVQYFDGKAIKNYKTQAGKKMVHYQTVDDFVFKEWIKFQKYAEVNL